MASRALRKRKRTRVDEATKIARELLPLVQAERGGFRAVDIVNHADADHRRMVRSGEKRTIRKVGYIERLARQLELEDREAAAAHWYAEVHSLRYDTLGVVGKYGDGGRSGAADFDHMPANAEQDLAADQFRWAREGISAPLRLMFDRIVINEWNVNPQTEWLFRLALRQLLHRIEGYVGL